MTNSQIADIFYELSKLLEIKGDNPFKIRAYINAADTIKGYGVSIEKMLKEGQDLTKIPSIGKEIAKKIEEIVKTGKLRKLELLKQEIPPTLEELLAIEGLGAKRVKRLYQELHITNLQELKEAALKGEIAKLKGFGIKIQDKILQGLKLTKQAGFRHIYADAEPYAEAIVEYLQKSNYTISVTVAGSFRRRKETVGDLDILCTSNKPLELIEHFVKYKDILKVISAGSTRSTIVLKNNLQIDLRVVEQNSYGSALHYFTGSKAHVIKIRDMALDMGLKVNEYGIYKNNDLIASKNEEEVYRAFNLSYIEPELRENRGEIEAARDNRLPKLITMQDIKGDLHINCNIKDIKSLANEAIKKGYSYIGVSIDKKSIKESIKIIDTLNKSFNNFRILKTMEVAILEDGSLEIKESILKELDIVHAAIKSAFDLDKTIQTARLIKAINNPLVNIISHLTARVINKQEPISFDFKKVIESGVKREIYFEIDARANRADMPDYMIKEAKVLGAKFSIASNASSADELANIKYGVFQARRGWLEKDDVINTNINLNSTY